MDRPFPAYQGDNPYIFVSYAHTDSSAVFTELEWLQDLGFNIWYDEGISPGTEWREELGQRIKSARLFLYFVTPDSVQSENCRKELNFAIDEHIPVLAVHLKQTELLVGVKLTLSDRQAIFRYEIPKHEYQQKLQSSISIFLDQPTIQTAVSLRKSNVPILTIALAIGSLLILAVGILLYRNINENVTNTVFSPSLEKKIPDDPVQSLGAEKPQEVRSNWIAVLPFATLSGAAEMDLLARGITIQMIQALAPISSFSIVPYRNVENFADRTMGLDEIAQVLNVRYLLDGRIQQSGGSIRISIALIDGILGKSLWQESKTFVATDRLTIQDEITLLTTRILSSRMEAIETRRLATLPKKEKGVDKSGSAPTFLDRISIGLAPLFFDQVNLETSINNLKRALELDPNNARLVAQLAQAMNSNIFRGGEKDKDEARAEACRLANRAVLLGGDDPQSVRIAAFPIASLCGNAARAIQLGERAVIDNPENARAWASYGSSLAHNGQFQEALAALDRAEQVYPDAQFVRTILGSIRAFAHMIKGDWVLGTEIAEKVVNDDPASWLQVYLANGLGLKGDLDGAREQWQLVKARYPGLTIERFHWYSRNYLSEVEAQRFVDGLVRAKVESEHN